MRTLIRFIREAWPLVRRRKTMSAEAYERAKADLIAKYVLEQAPKEIGDGCECYVAIVRSNRLITMRGIADSCELARDVQLEVDDSDKVRTRTTNGHTLTIHLDMRAVQELRLHEGTVAE